MSESVTNDHAADDDRIDAEIRKILDFVGAAFASDDDTCDLALEAWTAVHSMTSFTIRTGPHPSDLDTSEIARLVHINFRAATMVAWQLLVFMSEATGRTLPDLLREFETRIARAED